MPATPDVSTPTTSARPRTTEPAHVPFYDGVLHMGADELLACWATDPNLDEPRSGRVAGVDRFVGWAQQTREWLLSADAAIRPVYVLVTPTRTVEEVAIDLTLDGERRELPVAIVGACDGGGLTALRIYHSMWPLTRGHEVRRPLLSRDPSIVVPDAIGDYQRALAAGDLEGILAAYEDGATAREPAGGQYVFTGKDSLRHIYSLQFADGAGIPLQHCTMTDDGIACALEYHVGRWGHAAIEPQAGVAVYERGTSGKIAFARIYDDIDPPAASDSTASVENVSAPGAGAGEA
jgi:SnoaL-like domain